MPPATKALPSGGGSAAKKDEFVMPKPPAVVVWRNAPGGETSYAMVTKYNRHSVELAIFVPESRVVVPKTGVRFIGDPWNQTNGINADSGVWDFNDETLLLRKLLTRLTPEGQPA